jgi:hypothetical protein
VKTEQLKVTPEFVTDFAVTHEVSPLKGGASNAGMALHKFSRDGQDLFRIVEKRTKSRTERDFYKNIYHILEASDVNVPRLYKVLKREGREYSIFTEAVHAISGNPVLDEAGWAALGAYFSRLARLDLPGLRESTMLQKVERDTLSRLEAICVEDMHRDAFQTVHRHLPAMKTRLSELPHVSSHLDLSWKNMAAADGENIEAPYIFDWGTARRCFVGADLHFFAEQILSGKNPEYKEVFFQSYTNALCLKDMTGADLSADDILLAALVFGVFRRLQWVKSVDPVARPRASQWLEKSLPRMLVFLARQSKKMADQKGLG